MNRTTPRALALLAVLLAAGCESAEDRAEAHYQEALAFLAEGDMARAAVEFRNVFDLDGQHRDARAAYAAMLAEEGDVRRAYSQYLRLAEQYPEDVEARRALALLAAEGRSWDEAERHAEAGLAHAPDDPGLRAAAAAVTYARAVSARDAGGESNGLRAAEAALRDDPSISVARLVVADALSRKGDDGALADVIEAGLEIDPENRDMHQMRLVMLARSGDEEAIGEAFAETVATFPDDEQIGGSYVRWLVSSARLDEAETYLRARVEADPTAENHLILAQFLGQQRGPEAQLAELDRMISEGGEFQSILRAMRASLNFEQGREEEGLREMADLLAELDEEADGMSPEQRARLHVSLAQMRDRTGDRVGARSSIERALEIEPGYAEALKIRGRWLIEDDQTTSAIAALRGALGSAPRDPEVMTLLALAHQRDGDADLTGEMLARAVEVSGSAPEETLRYAAFLSDQGRLDSAVGVLADALALAPRDTRLLAATGQLYARTDQWVRLDEIVARLEALEDPEAATQAAALTASALRQQDRLDELAGFLSDLDTVEGTGAALVRTEIARGNLEAARRQVDTAIEAAPDDVTLLLLRAGLRFDADDPQGAMADLRRAVEANPDSEAARLALLRGMNLSGESREATLETLREAAAALPDSPRMQWLLASQVEASGDLTGALEIYRRLYDAGEASPVIANNFASLLSTLSDDAEDLDRAERIARRLRGSQVPAFRDTYGWILHRLGRSEQALEHLDFAADGMPEDGRVRLHLALALDATGRAEEASAAFEEAARLAEAAGDTKLGAEILAARQ